MATRQKKTTVKAKWDLFKHGLSATRIVLWLTCREQFRLDVCEGWRARDEKLPLAFGEAGHWILDQLRAKTGKQAPKLDQVQREAERYEKLYRQKQGRMSAAQAARFETWFGLLVPLIHAYCLRWDGDWTGKYTWGNPTARPTQWLASERYFQIPFELETGESTKLNGKWDAIFEGKAGRNLWIFDTKFMSRIDDGVILDALPLDFQMNLYLWAAWQEFDRVPAGVIYDIVRRPGHSQGKKETLEEFHRRVAHELLKPEKFDHNFIRLEMTKTRREIEEWEETQLTPILEDIRMWVMKETPHYVNPVNLITKYGPCDMFGPIVRDDFTRHTRSR